MPGNWVELAQPVAQFLLWVATKPDKLANLSAGLTQQAPAMRSAAGWAGRRLNFKRSCCTCDWVGMGQIKKPFGGICVAWSLPSIPLQAMSR